MKTQGGAELEFIRFDSESLVGSSLQTVIENQCGVVVRILNLDWIQIFFQAWS